MIISKKFFVRFICYLQYSLIISDLSGSRWGADNLSAPYKSPPNAADFSKF